MAAGAAASLAFLIWTNPTGEWTLGLMAGAVLAVGVSAAAYLVPLGRSLRVVRAMDEGSATLRLSDEGLEVESAGRAAVPLMAVGTIVETPDAWLLVYSRSSFSTLPLADLPDEARAFITDRVRGAGGTV